MSTPQEPGGRQDEDGSANWEHLFEDETEGLIPEIQNANTPFVIKEFATVIIQQLFVREDDTMTLMKHLIALNQVIPDDRETETNKWAVLEMREGVVELLRKIKEERIQNVALRSRTKSVPQQERRHNF